MRWAWRLNFLQFSRFKSVGMVKVNIFQSFYASISFVNRRQVFGQLSQLNLVCKSTFSTQSADDDPIIVHYGVSAKDLNNSCAEAIDSNATDISLQVTKESLLKELENDPFLSSLKVPKRNRCYNCGMFGHLAESCMATSIRKVCFNCGSAGHISRECTEILRPIYCFRCQTPGHYSNECSVRVRNIVKENLEDSTTSEKQ